MFNLLKGEVYKLFRSKCLYGCSIAVAVFVLLMYGMFFYADMARQKTTTGIVEITVENTQDGASVWAEIDVLTIASTVFSSFGKIIIAIFAAIFVFGDYASGAIKNVVGKGYDRVTVYAAKYVSTAFGTIIIELVTLFAILVCEVLILGASRLIPALWVSLCSYFAIQILLGVALTGIMVMISQICRNLGLGIAISVCTIMFSNFITLGLNIVLSNLNIDINVCDYWILDLISDCPLINMDNSFVIRAIVCAIVWFVLALGVGGFHFRKADVK